MYSTETQCMSTDMSVFTEIETSILCRPCTRGICVIFAKERDKISRKSLYFQLYHLTFHCTRDTIILKIRFTNYRDRVKINAERLMKFEWNILIKDYIRNCCVTKYLNDKQISVLFEVRSLCVCIDERNIGEKNFFLRKSVA